MQTHETEQTHCSECGSHTGGNPLPGVDTKAIIGESDYTAAENGASKAVASFACYRNVFGQEQFDRYAGAFWLLASDWGGTDPNRWPPKPAIEGREWVCGDTILAKLKTLGGGGFVSLLPILGWLSALSISDEGWGLATEELSRLVGLDRGTIASVARSMEKAGLVFTSVRSRRGRRLRHWWPMHLSASETAQPGAENDYFYFDHRLIHGGQWRVLRPVQRAAYIAIATRAHVHKKPPREDYLAAELLDAKTPTSDLVRCRAEARRRDELRLACVSYSEIARIVGYSENAIKEAVRGFKHPALWPGVQNDPRGMEHMPLWVYPTPTGNALLYHFRDHVQHWPWELLNSARGLRLDPNELAKRLPAAPTLA